MERAISKASLLVPSRRDFEPENVCESHANGHVRRVQPLQAYLPPQSPSISTQMFVVRRVLLSNQKRGGYTLFWLKITLVLCFVVPACGVITLAYRDMTELR